MERDQINMTTKVLLLLATFGCGTEVILGQNWMTFKGCITSPPPDMICSLDPATYTMTAAEMPLTPVSGVTIKGYAASPYDTTIQRAPNTPGSMISIPSGTSGVTIYNLVIDGNRYNTTNAQTGCSSSNNSPACGPALVNGGCIAANNSSYIDVNVAGSVAIDTVPFWNSLSYSLYMNSGTVTNSSFQYSRATGAWNYNGGSSNTFTDNYFGFNGTAGLRLSGEATVSGNTFYQNRWEMSDQTGGGQLYMDSNTTNATIAQNTINGNNWFTSTGNINGCYPPNSTQYASGIEIEPSTSSNSVLGNAIYNQSAEGIDASNVTSLTISGYYPSSPSNPLYIYDNGGDAGISVQGSSGVTLNSVLSRSNSSYGVHVSSGSTGSWTGASCVDTYSVPFGSIPNTTTCP
jgi:hypothetical protein